MDFVNEEIELFIVTVVCEGEFTSEFQQEIADYVADFGPEPADITYAQTLGLVGDGAINDVILNVAAADGHYVA